MSQKNETVGESEQKEWYFDLAKPIVKFFVAVAVIVTLWWLVENVQAAQEITVPLPGTTETVTIAGVISSVLTIVLMIAIVSFSSSFGRILHEGTGIGVLDSVSKLVGLGISVVFAYWMFEWVINEEHFSEYSYQYDIVFLIAGIVVVGWLGLIVYSNVDEIVEALG
jgi:magnesium-transporting ATPase (P-type)